MRFNSALALSAAVAGILIAGQVMALPASGVSQPLSNAPDLPVVLVHGCHFDMGPGMVPDRENGPHYHNRQCAVVRTGPQGGHGAAPQGGYRPPPPPQPRYDAPRGGYGGPPRGYDEGPRRGGYYQGGGGYGRGYGYAPPPRQTYCRERCRYTGPFKQCRTVCD